MSLAATSSNNSSLAAPSSNRQSRLMQPGARLSFVSSSAGTTSIGSKNLQPPSLLATSSTFQPQQRTRMDHHLYLQHSNAADQMAPNANTSGLPAPISRQQQARSLSYVASGQEAASGGNSRQQVPEGAHALPSTVGAALRRRQASPALVPTTKGAPSPSSRLPSPGSLALANGLESGASAQPPLVSSFCVRRSQSQRPTQANGVQNINTMTNRQTISPPYKRTAGVTVAQFKPTSQLGGNNFRRRASGAPESGNEEEEEEEDEDGAESKCVESLPPLKSSTYISRLVANGATDNSKISEPLSEPIITSSNDKMTYSQANATTTMAGTVPGASKPSQLVKPLISAGGQGKRASSIYATHRITPNGHQSSLNVQSKFGLAPNQNNSKIKGPGLTRGQHRSSSSCLTSSQVSSGPKSSSKNGSKISLLPVGGAALSSSTKTTPSQQRGSFFGQPQGEKSEKNVPPLGAAESKTTRASDDEAESDFEDVEEEEDDDDDDEVREGENGDVDDDDDDATTATTITQTSDNSSSSKLLANANKELNNMIQMLSSSAILGDSDPSAMKVPSTSASKEARFWASSGVSDSRGGKSEQIKTTSQKDVHSGVDGRVRNKSKTKKVVKSYSLSFTRGEHEEKQPFNQHIQASKEISTTRQRKFSPNTANGRREPQVLSSLIKSTSHTLAISNQRPSLIGYGYAKIGSATGGLKLPRPRSRIIFDPTNSQFHVSCAPADNGDNDNDVDQEEEEEEFEDDDEDETNLAEQEAGRSSDDSSTDTTNDDLLTNRGLVIGSRHSYGQQRNEMDDDEQDEASLKLISTRSEIITQLKCLPRIDTIGTGPSSAKSSVAAECGSRSDQEEDSIRRLQDCRGSLDSLLVTPKTNGGTMPPTSRSAHRSDQVVGNSDEIHNKGDEQAKSVDIAGPPACLKNLAPPSSKQRPRSPVGAALRSLFGLQPSSGRNSVHASPSRSASIAASCGSGGPPKVATIVRHRSLRSDSRPFLVSSLDEPLTSTDGGLIDRRKSSLQEAAADGSQTVATTGKHLIGSDLLHRASKRLSASSSSLTSKFKFISSSSSFLPSTTTTTTVSSRLSKMTDEFEFAPTGGAASKDHNQRQVFGSQTGESPQGGATKVHEQTQKNTGLPPRMPTFDNRQTSSSAISADCFSGVIDGANECDHKVSSEVERSQGDCSTANGSDNDADATILSDTSTLHGDSTNMVSINRCAELERTVESLKNKLVAKEKELTDLQLKQWSSDYLIEQLKSTINKLEKENAQLKAVMVKANRVNL